MKELAALGKHVYFVGIKGAGMAGLALILKGLGYQVKGSDITDTFFTDDILRRQEIPFFTDFDARHITEDIQWAIASGAYAVREDNPEIQELLARHIPIVTYSQALGYLFNECFGIAVTGSHGKSTTAAMIAYVLELAGKDPFALVGGELLNWNSNARVPHEPTYRQLSPASFFVIEADEYKEQFLHYHPNIIAITNIDFDHPDYFATPKEYEQAFASFKAQLKSGGLVVQGPDPHPSFPLEIIGKHNQANASVAFKVCRKLDIPQDVITKGLAKFKGVRRRLERVGQYKGALIIDDYAHHPQEVAASLSALREQQFDGRLIVLFHPHTYSRTKAFLTEFAKALSIADEVYLLDIYASARESEGDVSSDDIIQELQALGRDGINLHTTKKATEHILTHLAAGDVFVTMGAGDVFRVAHELVSKH